MQIKDYSFKKGIPDEYKILFSTRFVTKKIIDYIVENTHSISLITKPNYSITTFLNNDTDETNIESEIYEMEKRVVSFIQWIQPTPDQLPIRIFWFPTKFKKKIPTDKKSLDVNEINSACTIHYQIIPNSYVVLYRREEAKKVLFHELVHLFHLDANIPSSLEYKIRNRYNLNLRLPCSLAETYAEFMGCLLNIYYISNGIPELFHTYLAIEQAFSLYQVNKILKFFYIDNINDLSKLNSDTNLMTYYFLKTALITHENITDFFYSLMKNKLLLDEKFLPFFEKYLDNLQNLPKYLKYVQKIKLDDETMRMTIVE
jgi:hypothetical protein